MAFTSAHSHYTIKRSTWMMGMGLDAAINVAVDADGKMSPQALDEAITKAKAEGLTPFCVNATCGTTVLGVFEDLVRRLCANTHARTRTRTHTSEC